MQGIHADNLLIIVDEACAVVRQMWMAISALMTTGNCHVVAIGNPDDPVFLLRRALQAGVYLASNPHPAGSLAGLPGRSHRDTALHRTDVPDREGLPQALREAARRGVPEGFHRRVGIDGNAYQAKVLAEFPQSSKDGVIPFAFFNRCS